MQKSLWTCLALAALLWPLASAAAPAGVTSVAAIYDNGSVHVTWLLPSADADVASFRIYTSHQSILGNSGKYDDYDQADASASAFDIKTIPPEPTLFVTVAAVDSNGNEGPFLSEAVVDLPANVGTGSPTSTGASVVAPAPNAGTISPSPSLVPAVRMLKLLSAESTSATGVTLTFSDPVTLSSDQDASSIFHITGASGSSLTVQKASAQGTTVLLTTGPQKIDALYFVSISDLTGDGQIPLDPQAETSSFIRFTDTPAPTAVQPIVVVAPVKPTAKDVTDVQLGSTPLGNGMFTISAMFTLPEDSVPASSFEVLQSIDGGRTFILPQTIAGSVRRLTFDRVFGGAFSILIRTHGIDGSISHGTIASLSVDGSDAIPPVASVTARTQPGRYPLTSSGAGAIFAFALSGTAVGWLIMGKRLRTKAA